MRAFTIIAVIPLIIAGCSGSSPTNTQTDPGPFTSAQFGIDQIAVIDEKAEQPDTIPSRRVTSTNSLKCGISSGNAFCSTDTSGWHIGYSESGESRAITILFDSTRREIAILRYAYTLRTMGSMMASHYFAAYATQRIELQHLPYTIAADGSLTCDISGSAVPAHLVVVNEGGYGEGSQASDNYSRGSKYSRLQPEGASIHLLLK